MRERYARVTDFIKLHFCLSQRTDSRFWTDNVDPASIPASLQGKLTMWRALADLPSHRALVEHFCARAAGR